MAIPLLSTYNETLPPTHRALILESRDKPIKLTEVPTPQPAAGNAIIRPLAGSITSYAGDVYTGKRQYPFPTPLIPGGSCVARVAAVGPDSANLKPGQLVYVHMFIFGRDDDSERMIIGAAHGGTPGSERMMEGEWRDSTWAEFAKVPLENCIPLDETRLLGKPSDGGLGYSIDDLVYIQAALVAYGGLVDVALQPGETVIVAPATGGFGGAAVQVALAMGAGKVVAMGRNKASLERVAGLSPRVTTVQMTGDMEGELKALQTHGPVDVFFDISPTVAQNSTHFKAGILALRHAGRVSLMGGLLEDLPIPHRVIMRKNITLKGKWMYERGDIPGFMRLVESGLFKLGREGGNEIVATVTLEEYQKGFELAAEHSTVGKMVVMKPQGK